jgi:uncharacterized C2H2 Zn-finger protein
MTNMNKYGKCPKCGASWDAGRIPKKDWKHYFPPYKYSHIVGVVCPVRDRVIFYECPFCRTRFEVNEIDKSN